MTTAASTEPPWTLGTLHGAMPEMATGHSWALVWATETLKITRDGERYELMAGDLMLVDRQVQFVCQGSGEGWSARMLDFGSRNLERMVDQPTMVLWRPLIGTSPVASAVRKLWLALHGFHTSGQRTSEYQAMDLLIQTLVNLVQGLSDASQSNYVMGLLARAKAIVQINLPDPDLSVRMVADRLGLSPRRVAAIFSAEHTTPTAFITSERMKAARTLLVDSLNQSRRIESIAWMCGFRNHNHFCRVFKAQHSISPSSYRRTHQQK